MKTPSIRTDFPLFRLLGEFLHEHVLSATLTSTVNTNIQPIHHKAKDKYWSHKNVSIKHKHAGISTAALNIFNVSNQQ
jgi:hypothetical protein